MTARTRRLGVSLAAIATSALVLGACSNPDAGDSSASGSSAADKQSSVTLLDNDELGQYNPVSGYARSGDSHVYEGLYRIQPGVTDKMPQLQPVLAAGKATASEENTVWTVPVKEGVTFSDGSTFGPEDVVATYSAILDPRSASEEYSTWEFVDSVKADGNNVVFKLKEPFAEFDRLLLNGIAPSEAFNFDDLKPAEESELNTKPVGTGPYVLQDLRADEAVFVARDDYRDGAPDVTRIVVRHVSDENARAQQLRAGEGDGTILEPALALEFEKADGFAVESAKSADWRGITLPAGNPVTGDDAIREAVNYAVNRESMVNDVMKGQAMANSTFLAPFYGKAYDPSPEANFSYDVDKANEILDNAGWKMGNDGVREKNGQKAAFDVIYFPNRDKARQDLTLAATSDLKKVGIEVTPVSMEPKNVTAEVYSNTPVMLGGGGEPYTVDSQIYRLLHGKYAQPGQGAKWDNASDYSNPTIDALLDAARVEPDADKRADLYRSIQKEYVSKPAMLQLVYVNHVYVTRDQGYDMGELTLEPHAHGVNFGPWLHINNWKKK